MVSSYYRAVIPLLLFLLTFSLGSSQSVGVDMDSPVVINENQMLELTEEIERGYRTLFDFSFACSGNCPKNEGSINPLDTEGQRVEICGERVKVVRTGPKSGSDADHYYVPEALANNNLGNLPIINGPAGDDRSLTCPPGEVGPMKFYYRDNGQWKKGAEGGSVVLYPKDRAKYLTVLTEEEPLRNSLPGINKPPQLYELRLTNETPSDVDESDVEPGDIIIMDLNPADNIIDTFGLQALQGEWNPLGETISVDYKTRKMKGGEILDADGPNFNSVLANPFEYGENCVEGQDEPCNAAMRDFDTNVNQCYAEGEGPEVFSGESCGPRCSLGHTQETFCAGTYTPDESEIMYTVSSSLVLGYRYPQISESDAEMCPSGYRAGEDCLEYTEVKLAGGPPTQDQLQEKLVKVEFANGYVYKLMNTGNDWSEPLRFHTCGKNLDLVNGKTVFSPTSEGGQLYRCDADLGEWKEVNTCNDGVDNDGDGEIDSSDSWYQKNDVGSLPEDRNCEETDKEYNNDCPSSIVGITQRDTDDDGEYERFDKAALYNEDRQGNYRNAKEGNYEGCRYNNVQYDIPQKVAVDGNGQASPLTPIKYWCDTENMEIAEHPIIPDDLEPVNKRAISKEDSGLKYALKAQQLCSDLDTEVTGYEDYGDKMLASVYKVPEKYIPFGRKYADSYGYAPYRAQSVRKAENKYFNGAPPSKSQLKNKGLNDTTASRYGDLKSDEIGQAWTVADYFAPNNEKVKGITLMGDDGLPKDTNRFEEFKGGLAPKCPKTEQWVYSGAENKCRKDIYHYVLPDISEEAAQEKKLTSMKIPTLSIVKLFQEGRGFKEAQFSCWRGEAADRPQSQNGPDYTLDLTESEEYPKFGLVDVTDNTLNEYKSGSYTCNTTMITHDGKKVDMSSSRWVNLWDGKSDMSQAANTVANIAHDYNLDYTQCSSALGIPCDIFKNISSKGDTVEGDFFDNTEKIPAENKDEWEKHFTYLNSVLPEFSTETSTTKCPGDETMNDGSCVRKLKIAVVPLFYDNDQASDFRETAESALKEFAEESPLREISDTPMDRIDVTYIDPSEVTDPETTDVVQLEEMFDKGEGGEGLAAVTSEYDEEDYDKVVALANINYFEGDSARRYTVGRASGIPGKYSVTLAREADGTLKHEMGHQLGLEHTSYCNQAVRNDNILNWQNNEEDDGSGEIMNYCDDSNYFSDNSDEYETLKYYFSEVVNGEPVY